jgi:transcriptional regulator with GAF, ATPase, and Fis domain
MPTDEPVTARTEKGIARAIHSARRRRDKPLIKLNCAALPGSPV